MERGALGEDERGAAGREGANGRHDDDVGTCEVWWEVCSVWRWR
jgi:hypothetical protein